MSVGPSMPSVCSAIDTPTAKAVVSSKATSTRQSSHPVADGAIICNALFPVSAMGSTTN